jgi:hypothetical protein
MVRFIVSPLRLDNGVKAERDFGVLPMEYLKFLTVEVEKQAVHFGEPEGIRLARLAK